MSVVYENDILTISLRKSPPKYTFEYIKLSKSEDNHYTYPIIKISRLMKNWQLFKIGEIRLRLWIDELYPCHDIISVGRHSFVSTTDTSGAMLELFSPSPSHFQ